MKIAFLFDSEPTDEQIKAYKWVKSRTGCAFKVEVEKISNVDLRDFKVIWWHCDEKFAFLRAINNLEFKNSVSDFFNCGGNILLTLFAVKFLKEIRIEPVEPDFESVEVISSLQKPRGFVSFFSHPIFRRLQKGVNTYFPRPGDKITTTAYVKRSPQNLKIVAVEKFGDEIKVESKIIFEYEGNGRIIGIGGNIYFRDANPFFYNLDRLMLNCLLYLNNPKRFPEQKTYWFFSDEPKQVDLKIESKALRTAQKKISGKRSDFLVRNVRTCFIQGEGIYALVSSYGIEKITLLPFEFIESLRYYLRSESIGTFEMQSLDLVFKPELVSRKFKNEAIELNENVFVHPRKPILVLNLLTTSKINCEICFEIRVLPQILESQAIPFKEFYFGYEEKLKGVYLFNNSFFSLFLGSARKPEGIEFNVGERLEIKVLYRLNAGLEKAFNFAIAGSIKQPFLVEDVIDIAKENYKFALKFPQKVFKENLRFVRDKLRKQLFILTPDEKLNQAFRLAVSLISKFVKDVKTLGRFVLDIPNETKIDLRKSFYLIAVLLKLGEYEIVRDTLEFIGRYINLKGKVPKSFSPFGVFEYDDEDERLNFEYIKLCSSYLTASKDKLFGKFTWRRLKRMIENCEIEEIERNVIDSLSLFALIFKDEEWQAKLSKFKVCDDKIVKEQDVNFDYNFDINSAFSISRFISKVLSIYCEFEVDSFKKRLYFSSLVRSDWGFLKVGNIRIQNMRVSVYAEMRHGAVSFLFDKKSLPEIWVIFEPRFEKLREVKEIQIDGKSTRNFKVSENKIRLEFGFRFKREVKIFFD